MCIAAALVIGGLDNNVVATAVPSITNTFHTSADLGWYAAAFRLSMCSSQFMFGKLYRTFSVKWVFMTTLCIFTLGTVLCATANSSKMFVLGRAVSGLGEAGLIAGCFVLIVHLLPLRRRPVYAAVLSGVESVAELVAPILGGVLTERLSWRWCFWITLPLACITIGIAAVYFEDFQSREAAEMNLKQKLAELDLLGNLFFLPALTTLFIALGWAGTRYAWDSAIVIGLLCCFVVLLGAFAYLQYRRGNRATLPPRILKQRSVLAGFAFSVCCSSSLKVLEYYMPTYFQVVQDFSPAKSGYITLPIVIGFIIGMQLCGTCTTLFGYYNPFMVSASVLLPIASGLITTWKVDTGFAKLIVYPGLLGFASGVGWQGPQFAVQTSLPTADAPIGLSIYVFSNSFGPALFVSVASTIFTNQLSKNLLYLAPGLDAESIENMGLGDLKAQLGTDKIAEALQGFVKSLVQTWYLAVALCCASIVGTALMEWRSVKQKRQ